jgi:hypothetical protein
MTNNGNNTLVYDRFGNRWQQIGPQSFIATFTGNNPGTPQNNNRMDGYSYDAAGNLLNDGVHSYTYDAENHIIKVDSGNTATYLYDPDGTRVQKTAATGSGGEFAGTWQFLYDQSGHMIQRFDGTFWQGNIYADSRHLVQVGSITNFSHSDWLGTERVRTNNTGVICESIASLPFGDGQTTTGACYHSSPLHFTGKFRDSESGLDNFGERYFGSSLGGSCVPTLRSGQALSTRTIPRHGTAMPTAEITHCSTPTRTAIPILSAFWVSTTRFNARTFRTSSSRNFKKTLEPEFL